MIQHLNDLPEQTPEYDDDDGGDDDDDGNGDDDDVHACDDVGGV